MVEVEESREVTATYRYICEKCRTTYVHKSDAITCEKRCSMEELEKESLFEVEGDGGSRKSWTDHSMDDLS